MSRAAAKKREDPVEEPDRLEGFSSPREVDRLFGHDAARAEFGEALTGGRLHHAWLLVGPEGVGKATLAYHLAREVLALREGDAASHAPTADHPVFRKVAAPRPSKSASDPPLLERQDQALLAMDRRRRGAPLAQLPRP